MNLVNQILLFYPAKFQLNFLIQFSTKILWLSYMSMVLLKFFQPMKKKSDLPNSVIECMAIIDVHSTYNDKEEEDESARNKKFL